MKQTAVEWLQDTWLNYPDLCSYDKIQEWFKQAKEMENERVTEAYRIGRIGKSIKEFNETFKSE
jgi:hypothetical protein